MKTKLAATLSAGKLAVTAEVVPPADANRATIGKMAASLPDRLDAVVVADNAEHVRCSALACAAILAGENGGAGSRLQPILSIVTRDRNRVALQSEVLGAAALGVTGLLCLSGEHQSLGVNPAAAGANDIDSIQLTAAVRALCEQGVGFAGQEAKVDPKPDFLLGATAHPYLRPMELNLMRLAKKVSAGAAFVLTQAVFDVPGFVAWMDAVRAAGLDKKVAILASVMPLTSVDQARRLAAKKTYGPVSEEVIGRLAKASDPAREGIAIAADMARQVKSIAGVRGVHILSGGCESSVAAVIQQAGLAIA
jgi:methylenetetrahydrofolate reductase (NADPH)